MVSCRRQTIQSCPNSWLSLKPLWLSKQLILFLIPPSSWGWTKTWQCPKGEDFSQHLNSGWLEAKASGSIFKVCKYIQSCVTISVSPTDYQSQVIWRCLLGSSHKTQGSRWVYKLFFWEISASRWKAEGQCKKRWCPLAYVPCEQLHRSLGLCQT